MSNIKISAVVCTYNRCDLLRGAVLSLLEQNIEKDSYEIIERTLRYYGRTKGIR